MAAGTDSETEASQIGIFVLTTIGPARVLRLAEEDPESQSIVCLNRSSTDVLQISGDYHRFVVKPSGIVQRLTGHGSYRLDVSTPIDAGKSWQLGIYAAHALKLHGRLQESDTAPATSLFLTGELAADLSVRDVQGIAAKIAAARPVIVGLQAAGGKAAIVVPTGGEAEAAQALGAWPAADRPALISARTWKDVEGMLSDKSSHPAGAGEQIVGTATTSEPATDKNSGRVSTVLLACLLLLLASIAGATYVYVGTPAPGPILPPVDNEDAVAAPTRMPQPVEKPPALDKLVPGPVAVELILATARNCRAMKFGNRVHDTQRHLLEGQPVIPADAPVCGLTVTVEAGKRRLAALVRIMIAAGPDKDMVMTLARRSLAGGASWQLPATGPLDRQQEVRVDIIFQPVTADAAPVVAELTADAFMAAMATAVHGTHRAATFTRIAGKY